VTVDDLDLPEELDFANPVSVLLREGTKRAHVQAEHSAGAAALLGGRLELEDYVRWMAVLWRVYE
jgi:heme oxygenase